MCSACEAGIDKDPARIQQWADQEQAWLRETIQAHGWAIQAVSGDVACRVPPFAYTIGLTRFGHSELVVFGLSESQAGQVLNRLGERACSGLALADGNRFAPDAIFAQALRVRRHPDPAHAVLGAVSRYGPRVTALQILVADEQGRFPGEPGYARPSWLQPEPGSFAA
jgi:hypothetical protein